MYTYIVFDVETPNRYNNRMSAIGITRITVGVITDSFFSFRNATYIVAKAFKTVIDVFPKLFDHIEFAVYCEDDAHSMNYEAFSSVFCI